MSQSIKESESGEIQPKPSTDRSEVDATPFGNACSSGVADLKESESGEKQPKPSASGSKVDDFKESKSRGKQPKPSARKPKDYSDPFADVEDVNIVNIGSVYKGVVSFGNRITTIYKNGDQRDSGLRNPVKKPSFMKVSEEIKSCELPLNVDHKYQIADHIGGNWKRLARTLPEVNFTEGQLDNLKHESENRTELVVNILNRWHEVAPKAATVGNLAKTLEKMSLADLAMSLEIK